MKKNFNISEVLGKFENIEKKFLLDNHKIKNINWWDFSRYIIYEQLLSRLNLNGFQFFINKKQNSKRTFFKKYSDYIIKFLSFFYYVLSMKSPIWIKQNTNLVFGHPRRIFEKNMYIDKYTDPFIEIFQKKINFTVIENPLGSNHLSPSKTKNLFYGDFFIFFSKILSIFLLKRISDSDEHFLKKIENDFENNFKIKIKLLNTIRELLPIYKAELIVYKYFFKIKKPKNILVVNSIGYESMIEAAKSLKITTYELQHGSPSRGKLNYDYSSGIKKKNISRFFFIFWKIFY